MHHYVNTCEGVEVIGQLHVLVILLWGNNASVGGCLCPRVDLDAENEKSILIAEN
jgi:hypothetical protein